MHQLTFLAPFFRRYWWRYAVGLIFLLVVDLLQLVTPRILGQFADAFQQGLLTPALLGRFIGVIVVVATGIAVFRLIWRVFLNGTARLLEYWLRRRLFQHLLSMPASFFDHETTGNIMALATNDMAAVRSALGIGVVMLTDAVVLTLAALTIMASSIDPTLTLLAFLPLPCITLTVALFRKTIRQRFTRVQEAFGHLTQEVEESVAGIRVIQTFCQEQARAAVFSRVNSENLHKNLAWARVSGLFFPLVQFIATVSFLVVLTYGGRQVLAGRLSLGDFVAFNSYLGLLTWPMMALGWVVNIVQRGNASLARINNLLSQPPAASGHLQPSIWQGSLEARSLTFTYPGSVEPALQNVTFSLEPGQTLGIWGRTGSGKSTLAHLLLRLYEPPPGTIFLNGQDLQDLDPGWLRQQVGFVSQEAYLFSATLAENIAFAGSYSQEQIAETARLAHLWQDLPQLPQGLDTLIGERGVTLSGGQRQRVALARALIKDPPFLLLDDCLSAVDAATEAHILADLKRYHQGRTVLIIAHRISALREADHILVLEEGRVVEKGTHQELLALQGLYARAYQRQARPKCD